VLESVVADLAVAALLRMGRQIETAAKSSRDPGAAEDLAACEVLSSMNFEKSTLRLSLHLPRDVTDASISKTLSTPEAEAISFEVLALVLTESLGPARARIAERWANMIARDQPAAAKIADELLERLILHYEIAARIVRDGYPRAYFRLREESHHRRISCVLEAIHRSLEQPERTISPDEVDRFSKLYRSQVRQGHKYITPPDFESRKTVAVEELYVSPTIKVDGSPNEEGRQVADLFQEIDRTVLLGDPGHGKSTASQVLIYQAAQLSDAPLPFLVVLRDFAGAGLENSVVKYLENRLSKVYQCAPPAGYVEHVLDTGRAFVVFDGLDELLDTSHRRDVTDTVALFCNRYPLVRTLVTSRRVGYYQAPMDRNQFRVLELSGFDRSQVEEYVEKWFTQEALTADEVAAWTRAFMRESESVTDLTRTPLLLALMCIIYRGERSLPRNRPAVYERCATMLFEKWDSSRGISLELRAGPLVDPAMKHLAYWIFSTDEGDGVTESALVRETKSYLHGRSFELEADAEAAAREFVEFCRGRAWVFSDVGTTAEGEALYKFTHRTFLEYFAAYHLYRTIDTPEELARTISEKVAQAEWDVVAQLAVQIADKQSDRGAIRIFDVLLKETVGKDHRERVNVLAFLTRCLSFVHLSPSVLRQLVRDCLAVMPASDLNTGFLFQDPISTLLMNAHFVDENVVESELRDALDKYVHGVDVRRRLVALSFISSPEVVLEYGRMPDGDLVRWRAMFEELESNYKGTYIDEFGKDLELSAHCFQRGWFSLSEYLDALDRGLDPILMSISISCRPSAQYVPYANFLIESTILGAVSDQGPERSLDRILWELGEIADYGGMRVRNGLSLCSVKTDLVLSDQAEGSGGTDFKLTERQLLGAGILLACVTEAPDSRIVLRTGWGNLLQLHAWLGRRGSEAAKDPVPWAAENGDLALLYRWVRGEIRFFSPAPKPESDPRAFD
jgi:hypothetical protein